MPDCEDAADISDDGTVDLCDPVSLLGHLFLESVAPPDPFKGCGGDPIGDDEVDCKTPDQDL